MTRKGKSPGAAQRTAQRAAREEAAERLLLSYVRRHQAQTFNIHNQPGFLAEHELDILRQLAHNQPVSEDVYNGKTFMALRWLEASGLVESKYYWHRPEPMYILTTRGRHWVAENLLHYPIRYRLNLQGTLQEIYDLLQENGLIKFTLIQDWVIRISRALYPAIEKTERGDFIVSNAQNNQGRRLEADRIVTLEYRPRKG